MNDIINIKGYGEYKKMLDTELKASAESFVRIGYLLKVARDTNVLAESGYKNVAEFAKAEYGLTKDIVSRYIAINDRYSEDGYSDRLQSRYENFGVAKLGEMLTLPDSIIEEIEPTLTRAEIQEIKHEVAEEEKITPLEVMAEAYEEQTVKDESVYTLTQRAWKEYFHENKKGFEKLIDICECAQVYSLTTVLKGIADILAPTGSAILFSRVPGVGKLMITIKGTDQPVTFINMRDGSKQSCEFESVYHDILEVFCGHISKTSWSMTYGEPFDEPKPEVAPVQQQTKVPKIENTGNVVKAEPEEHKTVADETETVADEPEIMPEPVEDSADGTEPAKEAEAAVIEEEPKKLINEPKLVQDILDTLHRTRRILQEHVGEFNDPLTEDDLIELEANLFDMADNLKQIRRNRQ